MWEPRCAHRRRGRDRVQASIDIEREARLMGGPLGPIHSSLHARHCYVARSTRLIVRAVRATCLRAWPTLQ